MTSTTVAKTSHRTFGIRDAPGVWIRIVSHGSGSTAKQARSACRPNASSHGRHIFPVFVATFRSPAPRKGVQDISRGLSPGAPGRYPQSSENDNLHPGGVAARGMNFLAWNFAMSVADGTKSTRDPSSGILRPLSVSERASARHSGGIAPLNARLIVATPHRGP
jgi:hypothetical protein